MITKRSKLLSLVLSMGLLLGLAVSGCTDKDRDPGPTPVPETADVYVNVGALDLAYDALYCTINNPAEDVDGEEAADEAFQVEVNEEGLGLIAEDQKVGSTISFTLSFQLEGEEVATYEADEFTVSADEEGNCIIVVDDVKPVTPEEDIDVYVDASNVKVGYTKAIAKVGEEETELEFDEDGISTTPVTTVKEGEKAKFSVSFIQNQADATDYFMNDGTSEPEFVDVEIATYDVSEEGVEVTAEEGKATVAIDEVAINSPSCLSFDLSQVTNTKEYKEKKPVYIVVGVFNPSEGPIKYIFVELREQGEGFATVSLDGIEQGDHNIVIGLFSEISRLPIADASLESVTIDQDTMNFTITDDDIKEYYPLV